jgi:hypothetical protein
MNLGSILRKKDIQMARGRKEKLKLDGAGLPETVPGLTPDEAVAYSDLRTDVNRHGWTQALDREVVILAARRLARARKFAALVAGLDDLLVVGANAQETMHPYCKELRAAEADLADSLRVLLLSPGSRKSVRVGGREMEQETGTVDPKMAKILKLMP